MIRQLIEDRIDSLVRALLYWEGRKADLAIELGAVIQAETRCKLEIAQLEDAMLKTTVDSF